MERYDYRKALEEDIMEYIDSNFGRAILCEMYKEDAYEKLYDELWVADSVTGNASGSYYCNAWKAEEAICHNIDLWCEACEEFGEEKPRWKGAEHADVTIRCYLLSEVLSQVLDEMFDEDESEDEDDD